MNISHIKISNILGIHELEFSPSGFTAIEGRNGLAKTSVLEAIKATLQTGHDATLLRAGAENGEVVLVLDDGMEIRRRVTEAGSTTEVRKDGKKIGRPVEAIRALADMMSVNPIDFLRAPKKDRVKTLLESMPLALDIDRLAEMAGVDVSAQPGVHPLAVIEATRKQVYDDRTGTNRAVKEKEGTINQLKLAMPEAVAGVTGNEEELRNQVEAARTDRDTMLTKIDTKLAGIKQDAHDQIGVLRDELQAAIDKLKAEAQTKVDAINKDTADNETRAAAAREKAATKFNDTVAPLNQALAVITSNRENAARREQAEATIQQMEEELTGLQADAAKQTKALEDIDAYKEELLEDLPIAGIELRDGEIYRDGVHLDRLNTAQQVQIAVDVAKLRSGELGVICVDGLELLDSATYEAFRETSLESGLQFFVTRVGDTELEINTAD